MTIQKILLNDVLEQFAVRTSVYSSILIVLSLYIFLIYILFSATSFKGIKLALKIFLNFFFYEKIFKNFINIRFDRFCFTLVSWFIFVLSLNLFGIFTYTFTFTASNFIPTLLAVYLLFWSVLITIIRFNINFFSLLVPAGTPGFLAKSLVVIEFISYVGRFFSLNVRLYINIISGHLVLKLLYGAVLLFIVNISFSLSPVLAVFSIIFVAVFIFFLEIFVACLQAYIFFFLICIYLKDCLW